jgi:ABC-type lipoprotein release transport system permease subunit
VSGAAILISLLATLYPAAKAARIEPAEALAYEH